MRRYRSYFLFAEDAWKESHYRDAHLDTPHFFHSASDAKNLPIESELTLSTAIDQNAALSLDALVATLVKKVDLGSGCAFFDATDKSWHVYARAINPYEHSYLKL
jgi:hypothetical protein